MLNLCRKRRRPTYPAVFQTAGDVDVECGMGDQSCHPSRLSPDSRNDIFKTNDPGNDRIYDDEDLDAWSLKALDNWRDNDRKHEVIDLFKNSIHNIFS